MIDRDDIPSAAELAEDDPNPCRCVRDSFGNIDPCGPCEHRAEEEL
jgi:hypothetical protein